MKMKVLLPGIFLLLSLGSSAQSAAHKWNVGLHGGFTQYNGDLGNGFYRFKKAFYGHGGISLSRYLNRRWDATILATRGVVGYLGPWNPDPLVPTRFITNLTTVNLLAKYNFFDPSFFMRPYLCGGLGVLMQDGIGDSYVDRGSSVDFAAPELGAGINFHIGEYVTFQIQELFTYNSTDVIDHKTGGINDMYLMHTAGLTFNLPKLGKLGNGEQTGVGDQIDKCPKIKQHRNKVTKSEGQSLRKEKRSKRKTDRKTRKISRKKT